MQTIDALICPRWTIRVEPSVVVETALALAIDGKLPAVSAVCSRNTPGQPLDQ